MSGPEAAQSARQRRAPLRHNLATVLAYLPNRGALAVIGFASFLAGLLEAGSLLLLARAAIGVTSGESRISLGPVDLGRGTALAIAAGLLVAKLALNVLTASIAAGLAAQTLSSHRAALLRAFHRASWSTQSALPSGRMQDVVTVQIERASEAVLALGGLVNAVLALAVLVASSLVVSPLGAAAVIVGGVALSALFRPLTARTRTFVGQQARAGQRFASAVAEATSVARDARTTGVDDELVARSMAASDEQLPAYRRARVLGQLIGPVYQSFALLILIGTVAGLTLVGGDDDSGTVGSLGAVILLLLRAVSYGQLAQQGVHQIAEKAAYLDEVATTAQSLGVDSVPSGGRDAPPSGRLEFRSVSFAYSDGADDGVLRDVDVHVEPGETIGVAGPSGSGKTTLVRLLLRLLDPTSGCITFGDVDLQTISLDAWYRAVAFVPQDPRFLTTSVADNIAMMRPVSRERIEQAARLANLHEEIRGLPQGYDTVVGPGGVALSGGQQQRLAVARALAVDPALLVLDEPTSALDAVSEALIHETLNELHGSVTTVIVAHRLSTLGVCDRILVLRDGGVEAFGAHHELLQSSPFYAAAVRLSALPD